MINSDNVDSSASYLSRLFGTGFFFCARLGTTEFFSSWSLVKATVVDGILSSNSALYTPAVGGLDSGSAAWCFTLVLCISLE